jgi:hypothetical protein
MSKVSAFYLRYFSRDQDGSHPLLKDCLCRSSVSVIVNGEKQKGCEREITNLQRTDAVLNTTWLTQLDYDGLGR